nr:PREDICTED: uncharacterized protein LOC108951587 [Musa acuminata subsp. malaccensis]
MCAGYRWNDNKVNLESYPFSGTDSMDRKLSSLVSTMPSSSVIKRPPWLTLLFLRDRERSSSMSSVGRGVATMNLMADGEGQQHQQLRDGRGCFQMPVRYPTYTQADYEAMPEWKLNCILREYGLPVTGDIDDKRRFAMGAFLWPAL